MNRMRAAVVMALLLGTAQSAVADDCTYDTCALRMKSTWGGFELVAGKEERKIATLGGFASSKPEALLAERSEIAAQHYREFRSAQRNAALVSLVGSGLVIGSFFEWDSGEGYSDTGWALLIGGIAAGLVGNWMKAGAQEKVSHAIWEYNGTFAE